MTVDTILTKMKPKWCIVMNDNWNNRDRLSFVSFTLIVKIHYTLHILSWWPDSAKILCTICKYSQNTWNMKHTLAMKCSSQKTKIPWKTICGQLKQTVFCFTNQIICLPQTANTTLLTLTVMKTVTMIIATTVTIVTMIIATNPYVAMTMMKMFLMKFCHGHCLSKA